MRIRPFVYALLLAAQTLLCLHEWIPHSHQLAQEGQNTAWWGLLENLISTNLGEAHLENIRPTSSEEQQEQTVVQNSPNDDNNLANQQVGLLPNCIRLAQYSNFYNFNPRKTKQLCGYSYLPSSPCGRYELLALAVRSLRAPPALG